MPNPSARWIRGAERPYVARVSIAENLDRIRERIPAAASKAGRAAEDIELIAVTKTHPAERVREAIEAGHTLFGENKVQEARAKIPELPSVARWHLIGHLQKNKVRHALPLFEMIHSVDSLELATAINRIADEDGHRPRILLEVNVSGEGSKFGFKPDRLREDFEALLGLGRVTIEGLMTIPPFDPEPEKARPYFAALRELRDELQRSSGVALPHLSMGMSDDFEIGIEEGATLVRVGTAIFGKRTPMHKRVERAEED